MLWAGVSMHTKTQLVFVQGNLTARRFQDEIVQPVLVPHLQANRGMLLAQDNANCHVARTTQNMFVANGVRALPWPAKSPDMNPIEHIWDVLKRNVRALPQQNNLHELMRDITQVWASLTQQQIQPYIISMRARCRKLIAANGSYTEY